MTTTEPRGADRCRADDYGRCWYCGGTGYMQRFGCRGRVRGRCVRDQSRVTCMMCDGEGRCPGVGLTPKEADE